MGAKDKLQRISEKEYEHADGMEENSRREITLVIKGTSIIMCFYFLELLAGCIFFHDPRIILVGAAGFVLFAVVFRLCHLNKIKQAALLTYAALLLYVAVFIGFFGWKSGVQNFLFGLLPLILMVDFIHMRFKIVCALFVCLLRFFLFYFSEMYLGKNELNAAAMVYMDIINIITVFVLVSNCVIVFSEEVFNKEERMSLNNKRLTVLASEDIVTGLDNRRSVMFSLKKAAREKELNPNKKVSIVIGDIDFFKHINDRYGHDCGDVVLRKLSDKFRTFMEDKGKVGRWGGEEFLFLFEDADGAKAYSYMEELQEWIRHAVFEYEEEKIRLTMTFGLMEYDEDKGVDGTIVEADKKLYIGKEAGRDRIVFE